MSYTDTVVRLERVTKTYGSTTVLDDLTLSIGRGIFALLGPNGAGKTTLVNLMSTLIAPDSGTITVLGRDSRTDAAAIRGLIAVTGQFSAIDDVLTGRENLVLVGRLLGLDASAAAMRTRELLAAVDLTEVADRRAATYSGGMRRRLDLAVSLLRPPALLFLDEPTTGLDTVARQRLWQQIRELAETGTAVVLTTQYLEEADLLADRIAVLDHGRIVAEGTAAELKALVGGAVIEVRDEHGELVNEIATDGTAGHVAAAVAGLPPGASVDVRRTSLDEAFLHLTGAGSPASPTREAVSA